MCFIDETHADEKASRRRRGWARRGLTPVVFEPVGHHRYTLIGVCNAGGFMEEACEIIEINSQLSNVDGERFLQWTTSKLIPVLGSYLHREPNSIVIMDNASIHRSTQTDIRELIQKKTGAIVVFLSPYSPDYNPIEEAFSKLKCHIRRHRTEFLSDPVLCLKTAMQTVTNTDMQSYFTHAGYKLPQHEDTQLIACILVFVSAVTTVLLSAIK
eukprot:c9680_g1_i2.p2 GENE.c9680_g1_i2~~c9680_g1_i2.p2  ORF type:complete len:213 (+),score=47.75 c9680_g1_i2:581-1219(+)